MAPIWKPQPFEVLDMWLKAILEEASDDLNDWETIFIYDMVIRVANKWQLTQSQEEKLESVYAKLTS
jgi:hypothetical protein